MNRKLSRTNLALVFFFAILLLSIYAQIDMQSRYHPSYAIYADKLDEKPANYFTLANPDRYVLQAIYNQNFIEISSPKDTEIDDLAATYKTNNVEYNNSYYYVALVYGDNFPPAGLPLAVLAGSVISTASILIIGLSKITKYKWSKRSIEKQNPT